MFRKKRNVEKNTGKFEDSSREPVLTAYVL